ncbi:uncharacterized protein LOC127795926 [Diospyros lotus]|uniref:uncharacterized protein LOC127795926 n=1 Tax=Diospyros lotus TaxID=55363 RepID=UPI00225BC747|nr:uncharacterized protein LOC127795926 [Diospyros lotus]
MEERRLVTTARVCCILLLVMLSPALACPPDGSRCQNCIVDRFKQGCPPCVPIMQCMARCLWDGNSRAKCTKKCDCNDDYPKLSDCKKCLSRCKCSCATA